MLFFRTHFFLRLISNDQPSGTGRGVHSAAGGARETGGEQPPPAPHHQHAAAQLRATLFKDQPGFQPLRLIIATSKSK